VVFAFRNAAGQDEGFGSAADGAKQRPDANLARCRWGKRLFADFGFARARVPERFGDRAGRAVRHNFIRFCASQLNVYAILHSRGKSESLYHVLQRSTHELTAASGAQENLTGRRLLFAALVAVTMAAMIWLMAVALSPGGFGLVDLAMVMLFAVTLPWTVIGFWNAAIGLLIMRLAADPSAVAVPVVARVRGDERIGASTALLLCIRNEMPERLIRNIEQMLDGIAAAGAGDRFHLYVLSDTGDSTIAASEDRLFGALAAQWSGRIAVTYRRRTDNAGFKAGNIRDFCERWGGEHEFAVTLDADSFMPAEAVLRMVRIMQADPKLGILQGLVVGLPSTSAFARLFQFSMRLSMRSYTIGSAWWQGDCGP
jgi:membrane glycosyltransferase